MPALSRHSEKLLSVAVDTVLADSDEINIAEYAVGRFEVPDGSSLTTITWHANSKETANYEAAYYDGVAVTQAVAAGQSHEIPPGLFGAISLKATGNADGTIHISLKG